MQIETYITDLIEGRKKSPVLSGMLYAMSGFFKTGITLRNFAFDHLIKETEVDIPVISIGNIIAGGTGKTALIQKLAHDLSPFGKVSVLLRGYRSKVEQTGESLELVDHLSITPDICGDEAYLLWKRFPKLSVFVGKNRVQNAKRAVQHQSDLILLDDGMQYRKLKRDFELVMLHADDLYGKEFYLPRGYLRDSPKRLAEADYVLLNHVESETHFEILKQEVQQRTTAPLIGMQMVAKAVKGKAGESWEDVKGKRVAAFCGLGKPDSFMKTVEKLGVDLAERKILPDHIAPNYEELRDFAAFAEEKGCELILCSEKDWVKLPSQWEFALPIAYVEATLEVVSGQIVYEKLLHEISSKIKRKHEALD